MGYRAPRPPIGKVTMTGELTGLEVVSVRAERKMLRIASYLGSLSDSKSFTDNDLVLLEMVYAGFAEALISWNLEDWRTGEPVPPTLDGMLSQDSPFMLEVISAWLLTAPTDLDPEEIEAIEAALIVVPLAEDRPTDQPESQPEQEEASGAGDLA